MAISLSPVSGGSVLPEYAAASHNINHSVTSDKDGLIATVSTVSIAYARTDYLLNAEGKKVGVVTTELGQPQDPNRYGNLFLNADEAASFLAAPNQAEATDALIKADLVKRGIITE